jgi:uncharacterized protein
MGNVRLILGALAASLVAGSAFAEDAVGDWIGKVKAPTGDELTIAAHIKKAAGGGYEGFAESPDQVTTPIPMADIAATPDTLAFATPAVNARFAGKWDPAARGWVGTLTQGAIEMPLTLSRGTVPPRPVVAGLDGDWAGVISVPQGDLRLLLHVKTDAGGTLALFESPDQSPIKVVAVLTHEGDAVTITLMGIGGFDGKLSADGTSLEGHWRQMGGSIPLTLKKGG